MARGRRGSRRCHRAEHRDPGDGHARQRLVELQSRLPAFRSPPAAADDRPVLTPRETEVVRLAVAGSSAQTIAMELGIGERTVETHLSNAYRKLGVHSRARLAAAIDVSPFDGPRRRM